METDPVRRETGLPVLKGIGLPMETDRVRRVRGPEDRRARVVEDPRAVEDLRARAVEGRRAAEDRRVRAVVTEDPRVAEDHRARAVI